MTTILAVQGDGWAVLGADSLVSDSDGRRYPLGTATSKIVRRGRYHIAAAGDVRGLNILEHVLEPPDPGKKIGPRLDRFIVSKFIPAMRQSFEDHGYAPSDRKEQAEQGSSVVMTVNGTVYHIGYDYSWLRNDLGVYFAGSGGDVGVGALTALCGGDFRSLTTKSAIENIEFAIEVASMYDIGTESPSTVIVDRYS